MSKSLWPLASSQSAGLSRRAMLQTLAGVAGLGALAACGANESDSAEQASPSHGSSEQGGQPTATTAADIVARAVVPVLCYHQVRPWTSADTEYTRQNLVIPPQMFGAHLDAMAQAGYSTISADAYYSHLATGAQLPDKPVLISFDDGTIGQADTLVPALTQRGMTGTIFIMSVVIGNKGWVTKDDIKKMADAGITIGSHTWDHHRVDKYTQSDVEEQLVKPRETLAKISGQPVHDFAYPYGAWNEKGAGFVQAAGYRTGYQLMDSPVSPTTPMYSIRRQLAVSTWTGPQLIAKLDGFATSGRDTTYSAG